VPQEIDTEALMEALTLVSHSSKKTLNGFQVRQDMHDTITAFTKLLLMLSQALAATETAALLSVRLKMYDDQDRALAAAPGAVVLISVQSPYRLI
jgi:hypothetical protein